MIFLVNDRLSYLALSLRQMLNHLSFSLRSGEKTWMPDHALGKIIVDRTIHIYNARSVSLSTQWLQILCMSAGLSCLALIVIWWMKHSSLKKGSLCSSPIPISSVYGGGTLANPPFQGLILIPYPQLVRNVSETGVYYHCSYGCEEDILSSALECNSLVLRVPLSISISCLTIKDMWHIASMHNISLPSTCCTREQVSTCLLSHDSTCKCGKFVSIFSPSAYIAHEEHNLCELETICSLDLCANLLKGDPECGVYQFIAYGSSMPASCIPDNIYVLCPMKDIARFAPLDILNQVCHSHRIELNGLDGYSDLSDAVSLHVCNQTCPAGISQFSKLPEPVPEDDVTMFPPPPLS